MPLTGYVPEEGYQHQVFHLQSKRDADKLTALLNDGWSVGAEWIMVNFTYLALKKAR